MTRHVLAFLALSSVFSANAQTLALACEYHSGFFRGQIISVSVDYATNTVYWGGDNPESAVITERYITIPLRPGVRGRRIDRTTGIVAFDTGDGVWDATLFGTPGLVCQPRKGF